MLYVAGGGTGGHFFPALALMECLLEREIPCKFIGAERGIEKKLSHLLPVEGKFLKVYPFFGRSPVEKLRSLYSIFSSSLSLLPKLGRKDVSIIFGGYASLPLGLASVLRRTPLFLHEQNSVPSTTNQLLSRFAKRVFVSFEYSKKFFPKEKVVKTGLPVRRALIDGLKLSKEQARASLNLSDKPTLLVMGGSQGAVFLNSLAFEIFKRTDFQGVHITGEKDYERFKDAYKNMPVLVLPFTENMGLIYRACDLALCRAGASTITELSLYGVPALFIPFPHAIRDHQYYNAKEIEGIGGGLVLTQEEAELNTVLKLLEKILSNREEFSKAIACFAEQNPCEKILNSLQEFLPRH